MEYDLASKINVVFLFKYRCFKNLLVLLNSMLGVSLYVCVGGGGGHTVTPFLHMVQVLK